MTHTNVLLVSADPADREAVRAAIEGVRGQPYRLDAVGSLEVGVDLGSGGGVPSLVVALERPAKSPPLLAGGFFWGHWIT